jgi:hypothetical protein
MKFYRNHLRSQGDASAGYEFFTSKRAAIASAAKIVREGMDAPSEIAVPIEVAPNKAGICAALNRYAGHPDNG